MNVFRRMVTVGFATLVLGATTSVAIGDSGSPTLNAAQLEKLQKLQAQFVPGGPNNSGGYGFDKVAEFCGANIPITLDPSLVALEKPNQDNRTRIDTTCQAFGGAIAYTCGYSKDADPVVKEMIRTNVKRMVCRATTNASELNNMGVNYALKSGTLTFTVIADEGKLGGANIQEEGEKFLLANVRQGGPDTLSIGGQQLKRKMLANIAIDKNTLRKGLKEECNIELASAAIDDKLAEHYSKHLGHSPLAACEAGLQVVYNNCREPHDSEITSTAVGKALKTNLKGISCVYSDIESIAVRPNGILELGGSVNAPRPKFNGRSMMSSEEYKYRWLKANIATLGGEGSGPAAGEATASVDATNSVGATNKKTKGKGRKKRP